MARKRTAKDNITPFPVPPQPDVKAREWESLAPQPLKLPEWVTAPLKAHVLIETIGNGPPRAYEELWCAEYAPFGFTGMKLSHVLVNRSEPLFDKDGKAAGIRNRRAFFHEMIVHNAPVLIYPITAVLPESGHQDSVTPPEPPVD